MQRGFAEDAPRSAHDGGHHLFLGQFRRHRKYCCGGDRRIAEQYLLHLVGRNVFTATPDGVLEPVQEAERTVSLAHHAVASVKPAVPERRGRLLRHREIAGSKRKGIAGP